MAGPCSCIPGVVFSFWAGARACRWPTVPPCQFQDCFHPPCVVFTLTRARCSCRVVSCRVAAVRAEEQAKRAATEVRAVAPNK